MKLVVKGIKGVRSTPFFMQWFMIVHNEYT